MDIFNKDYKKIRKYLVDHPDYNAAINMVAGAGIGILMTYPLAGSHPMRWSLALILLAFLGHLYPLANKK